MAFLLQIIAGILGGIAASFQGAFTGVMGQKTGELASVFITYCGGALLIAAIVLANGGGRISEWRTLPWYVYLAGPFGLIIIWSLSYTIPRLGATGATILFILAWLACNVVIDQFGWLGLEARPLDLSKSIGLAALLLGTWLVLR